MTEDGREGTRGGWGGREQGDGVRKQMMRGRVGAGVYEGSQG